MSISPQGDYGSVLEQEERVGDASFFAKANELLLQSKTGPIVNGAELKDGYHAAVLESSGARKSPPGIMPLMRPLRSRSDQASSVVPAKPAHTAFDA